MSTKLYNWGHQHESYVTQHCWYLVVIARVEYRCISTELKVEGWALRLSSKWGDEWGLRERG